MPWSSKATRAQADLLLDAMPDDFTRNVIRPGGAIMTVQVPLKSWQPDASEPFMGCCNIETGWLMRHNNALG